MDKLNLKRFAVGNIFLASVSKILLSLIILVIFIFVSGEPAYADCCCDNGGYRIGEYCYGITCSSPHYTCICACPPGDDGSTIIPPATVGGKVIAEGETGGTSNLAGPNGNSPEPNMPIKAYCVAPTYFSCSSAAWDGNCEIYATCAGDYTAPICSWGTTTYGIPGTSSLSVSLDGTSSPNWISKVSINPNGSYCSGSVCVDRACIEGHYGPYFNFPNAIPYNTQHTFTVNPPAGYVCKSMVLSGATSVTVNNNCTLTATLNSGSHDLTVTIMKPPTGVVYGSIKNITTNINIKDATNTVCSGEAQGGFSVSANGDAGAGLTSCFTSSTPTKPYFTKTLNAGSTYTITANLPVGWRAIDWEVYECSETPTVDYCTATSSRFGTGATITGVPINQDKQTLVNFRVERIPPQCSINSTSSQIVVGETGVFSVTATTSQIVNPISVEIGKSASLSLGSALQSKNCGANTNCNLIYNLITDTVNYPIGTILNMYCRGWNDSLRECRPFDPLYEVWHDVDCNSPLSPYSVNRNTCTGSTSDCMTVTITSPGPWYQTKGGDVHAEGGISSYIPTAITSAYRLFNLDLPDIAPKYPGLISYTGSYDFSSDNGDPDLPGTLRSNSKKWLADSSFLPAFSSSGDSIYDYYLRKLGNPATEALFDCNTKKSFNTGGTVIIRLPSQCLISGNNTWEVSGNTKVIILVDGDLVISTNTNQQATKVNYGSFLAFIVKGTTDGGIYIDLGVGNKSIGYTNIDPVSNAFVQGVFMTDKKIYTGKDLNGMGSGFRFIGSGIFYAKDGFDLQRNLKEDCTIACNANTPAELFLYRPDLVVNSPSVMWPSETDWQEVAP